MIAEAGDFWLHVVGSSSYNLLEAVGSEVVDVEFEAALEVFGGQREAVAAGGNGCG